MELYFNVKICNIIYTYRVVLKWLNFSKEISIFIHEFVYLIILMLLDITDMQKSKLNIF